MSVVWVEFDIDSPMVLLVALIGSYWSWIAKLATASHRGANLFCLL